MRTVTQANGCTSLTATSNDIHDAVNQSNNTLASVYHIRLNIGESEMLGKSYLADYMMAMVNDPNNE